MFNNLNILKIFFEKPTTEFNVREIARMVKISPATASKKLNELKKEKLLKSRDERNLILYSSDLESELYKDMKKFHTIRQIKDSKFLESLNDFYLIPTIILFGSCSNGLDTETSDIDLVIISKKTKKFEKLEKFEREFGKNIQLFVFSNITQIKNKHLLNNVLNGTLIQGQVQWISTNVSGKD